MDRREAVGATLINQTGFLGSGGAGTTRRWRAPQSAPPRPCAGATTASTPRLRWPRRLASTPAKAQINPAMDANLAHRTGGGWLLSVGCPAPGRRYGQVRGHLAGLVGDPYLVDRSSGAASGRIGTGRCPAYWSRWSGLSEAGRCSPGLVVHHSLFPGERPYTRPPDRRLTTRQQPAVKELVRELERRTPEGGQ